MHLGTRRPRAARSLALLLAILTLVGVAACGGSRERAVSTPNAPETLPPPPQETTSTARAGTVVPVSSLPEAPTSTAAAAGSGGALPTAPSTTAPAAPPVSVAPAPPPTTPAPKVLSPELVRWCPVAGEAMRILLNGSSLTAADYDNALKLFVRVRDLAPAEVKPAMEKLIAMATTLVDGVKAGEVTGDISTDPNVAKNYIDAKMGPGTYDAGLAALQEVYRFGTQAC